ncbi:hepatic triacylglycerol lipase-like isoform X1 [Carassius carassius]|uniref:hepatic triacylglycerol lipase-like isoform X1 n=1 Tax=Carassius carassius TaxID=217509 RepID=UPI002869180B|nr:hepatic triacylglycerol lipase-like isoform X1 [Carassius carassius]
MRVLRALLLMSAVTVSVRGDTNFTAETPPVKTVLKSSFHLYHEGSVFEETCAVVPFRSKTLHRCAYNHSDPLVLIIHGWTMNGRMEPWIFNLASALKVRLERVNVFISDWRKLALQPYPVAAKNSRQVGRDVATLLKWLEEVAQLSMDDVHLIGYSLGAHVAGFAGSHFRGLRKVGRITGLDPAGPHFEGLPAFDRLSPDDAQFVDAVHTFTGSSIMPGVGIKQSVAHVDFYPNGGSFQPGCKMLDIYSNVFQYGLQGVPKTIKCAHERAVKLFTDSLINASQPLIGYRCRDDSAFSRGLCLDCKQLRCNTLGFAVRHDRPGRSATGLYLRTTPQPPYRVFHYQIRVLLKNLIEPLEASLSVTLHGIGGESPELPINLHQESGALKSFSSLLAVASDLGRLRSVRLVWKGDLVWSSWMRRVRNIMSWNSSDRDPELSVWRICIKSGESQDKTWFCGSAGGSRLRISEEQEFTRCPIKHQHTHSSASTQSVY